MSSENGWIPWDDRTDLKELYLVCNVFDDEYYNYQFVVPVGKVPSEYVDDVLDDCMMVVIDFTDRYDNGEYPFEDGEKLSRFTIVSKLKKEKVVRGRNMYTLPDNCAVIYDELQTCQRKLLSSFLLSVENKEEWAVELFSAFEGIIKEYEDKDKRNKVEQNYIVSSLLKLRSKDESDAVESDDVTVTASVERPIGRNENYPSTWIYAKSDETASEFTDNGEAGIAVAVSMARIADKQDSIDDKTDKILDKINSIPSVIKSCLTSWIIDSLDKIPLLDKESGEWLIASEYARTRKPPITVDTLKQGRSNVKNKNGKTKGLIAEDGSCGIHGKHVWRFGGYDNYNNEIYYYYKYGVDGKYTP